MMVSVELGPLSTAVNCPGVPAYFSPSGVIALKSGTYAENVFQGLTFLDLKTPGLHAKGVRCGKRVHPIYAVCLFPEKF